MACGAAWMPCSPLPTALQQSSHMFAQPLCSSNSASVPDSASTSLSPPASPAPAMLVRIHTRSKHPHMLGFAIPPCSSLDPPTRACTAFNNPSPAVLASSKAVVFQPFSTASQPGHAQEPPLFFLMHSGPSSALPAHPPLALHLCEGSSQAALETPQSRPHSSPARQAAPV